MAIRLYVDSNILIRLVESADADTRLLLERAADGVVDMVTSEIALAEVLVKPLRDGDDSLVADYEFLFTESGLVETLPVTRDILRASAADRAATGNKGVDAIHVASAEAAGCEAFLSADQRLRLPEGLPRLTLDQTRGEA